MTQEPREPAPPEPAATETPEQPKAAPAKRNDFAKRLGLIVFLSTPLLVLALLMWMIAGSLTEQANNPESLERHRQQQPE